MSQLSFPISGKVFLNTLMDLNVRAGEGDL